jgi:hypothetical protein
MRSALWNPRDFGIGGIEMRAFGAPLAWRPRLFTLGLVFLLGLAPANANSQVLETVPGRPLPFYFGDVIDYTNPGNPIKVGKIPMERVAEATVPVGGSFRCEVISSTEQYLNSIGVDVKAAARYGFYSGRGRVSYERVTDNASNDLYIAIYADGTDSFARGEAKTDPASKQSNFRHFAQAVRAGRTLYYVDGVSARYKVAVLLTFHASTASDKQRLQAALGGGFDNGVTMVKVDAAVKTSRQQGRGLLNFKLDVDVVGPDSNLLQANILGALHRLENGNTPITQVVAAAVQEFLNAQNKVPLESKSLSAFSLVPITSVMESPPDAGETPSQPAALITAEEEEFLSDIYLYYAPARQWQQRLFNIIKLARAGRQMSGINDESLETITTSEKAFRELAREISALAEKLKAEGNNVSEELLDQRFVLPEKYMAAIPDLSEVDAMATWGLYRWIGELQNLQAHQPHLHGAVRAIVERATGRPLPENLPEMEYVRIAQLAEMIEELEYRTSNGEGQFLPILRLPRLRRLSITIPYDARQPNTSEIAGLSDVEVTLQKEVDLSHDQWRTGNWERPIARYEEWTAKLSARLVRLSSGDGDLSSVARVRSLGFGVLFPRWEEGRRLSQVAAITATQYEKMRARRNFESSFWSGAGDYFAGHKRFMEEKLRNLVVDHVYGSATEWHLYGRGQQTHREYGAIRAFFLDMVGEGNRSEEIPAIRAMIVNDLNGVIGRLGSRYGNWEDEHWPVRDRNVHSRSVYYDWMVDAPNGLELFRSLVNEARRLQDVTSGDSDEDSEVTR